MAPLIERNPLGLVTDTSPEVLKWIGDEEIKNSKTTPKHSTQRQRIRAKRGKPVEKAFGTLLYTIGQGLNAFDFINDLKTGFTEPYLEDDKLDKKAY